jgi:hypothetical protein
MDYVRPEVGNGEGAVSAPITAVKSHRRIENFARVRKKIVALAALLVGAGGGVLYWKLFLSQAANANPFTAKQMASVQFPLYYPTNPPIGYHIDTKSVTEPQQGVIVFSLVGPKGEKLYVSEEARSETFDLGGFYNKFHDLKETPVSDGSIAVGRVNGDQTEVASRANNKTWILSNTSANIPLEQLTTMLKSLTVSY